MPLKRQAAQYNHQLEQQMTALIRVIRHMSAVIFIKWYDVHF